MSFQEDCLRFGDELARLTDAGMPVKEAAVVMGLPRGRCYAILQAIGLPAGQPRGPGKSGDQRGVPDRMVIVAVFDKTGSINQAAKACGVSPSVARRILVSEGLVTSEKIPPRGKSEAKHRFGELVAQGWSITRAAHEVGVHTRTARDWRKGIRKVGNTRVHPDGRVVDYRRGTVYEQTVTSAICDDAVKPAVSDRSVSDRYLSIEDRVAIADGLVVKDSLRTIAARIGKNVSTVSREVRGHSIEGRYLPYQADRVAAAARARPKQSKLVQNAVLRAAVEEGLSRKLSPEQISHRLRRDHPDDESMRVSHETIYQALYFQARGGLKREVQQALRTGRTRRAPQHKEGERYQRFTDPMIMISDRPAEVADRAVPGHWEGDLITGEQNKTAIGTLVERSTRYTMLLYLPDGHDAEQVRDALIVAMRELPAHLRGSLTWDQGAEMARHKQISVATEMAVYFCDPASPWQRGSNENTNGLLRQYFPKGTDLSVYGPEDLEHVAQELNGRPRKTLGGDTPAERLRDLITTN
jgi:IS30 family transposase